MTVVQTLDTLDASSSTAQPSTVAALLHDWRTHALRLILKAGFGFASIGTWPAMWSAWIDNRPLYTAGYFLIWLLLFALVFVREVNYTFGASVIVGICAALGFSVLYLYGLYGAGRFILFAMIIFLLVLFGQRASLIGFTVSLIAIVLVGGASALNIFVLPYQIDISALPERLRTPPYILADTVVFVLFISVILVGLISLLDRLSTSFEESAQAARAAEAARQQAEAAREQAEAAREQAEQHAAALAQQTETLRRTEQQLRDLVQTLETPTVPLAHGVLLAPLIGVIDAGRAERLTERLLLDTQHHRARTVIIDIAGVVTIDTYVAQALMHTARALRLLGCQVVLTGVSPRVAETIVQLGINLTDLLTAQSPQEVLGQARYTRYLPEHSL
ncbi:MAG: STAS domain-containing protein [Chloroflexaceae bacterium]|nr:STAS domain-containing protein [Chloroflexaceae bacterium]